MVADFPIVFAHRKEPGQCPRLGARNSSESCVKTVKGTEICTEPSISALLRNVQENPPEEFRVPKGTC